MSYGARRAQELPPEGATGPSQQAAQPGLRRSSSMGSRSELASMVEQLTEPSGSGSLRMLTRAGLCLAMGVVLVTGYHTPLWLVPFGIVFEGVSLAWFYLIQKERGRRMGQETGSSLVIGGNVAHVHDGKEESCKFTFARLWSKTKILRFWITSNAKAKLIAMAAKLSGMPAFLTDKNNPVGYCVQGAIEFGMDSRRLIQRCTKPDAKEFKKIAVACAIGFSIMGFIGYTVKLVFIPINNIIVGGS
eukprot:symbB.v1.2.003780.t1/scaffold214.1/size264264/2